MKRSKKIKIAVIGARGVSTPFSGIERQCEEVYSRIVPENFEVCVYSRSPYVSRDIHWHRGIRQKHLPSIQNKHLETFFHSFLATCHAVFSDADILHFHAQGPSLFSWIPRLLTPWKKIVFTCHGLDWQRSKWGFFAASVIKTGQWCSAYFPHLRIGVSEADVSYYREKYNKKLVKIPNGTSAWHLPKAKEIKEKFGLEPRKYFIFVGRLVPEKAIDDILRAYREIDTDIKLVITGDSSATHGYVADLKQMAAGDSRIIFTSFVYGDLLNELLTNSLAYVSASHLEGLPLTLFEALAHQIPVILSDIPPHVEILQQIDKSKPCGWMFKCGDIPSLKSALEDAINKPVAQIEEWGKNSREFVLRHFSWDEISKKYVDLYRDLVISK